MFGMTSKTEVHPKRVTDAKDRAAFKNIPHALNRLRKDMSESIDKSDEPSPKGSPPHTRGRGRKSLKRAFRYDYDKNKSDGIVGPIASAVGESGSAHEFGKEFRGEDFDERPFALPALEKSIDRFAQDWAGSI